MSDSEMGPLALSTRLRRLGRRTTIGLDAICREMELDVEPRWFGCLQLLQKRGPLSVTGVARALDQSHPAIIQLARTLKEKGLVWDESYPADKRRRLLLLSDQGRETVRHLGPLWTAIDAAARRWMNEGGFDLERAIDSLEKRLDRDPMDDRIRSELRRLDYEAVQTDPMGPGDEKTFADLNRAWIEEVFRMEDEDRRVLFHPRETIVERGGQVYMARLEGETVGTCALIREEGGVFELGKMAVDPAWQGRQVGARLCDHAIAEARRLGAVTIVLQTNDVLKTAMNLYLSRGWVVEKTGSTDERYQRSNVLMRLDLD